mmetsp:Transcript_1413/g.4237  ORF Transcript_1413/g.4237 Transcript_1413/m.4237 type:complete len:105 (+) Transcript_1413:127-441(+)
MRCAAIKVLVLSCATALAPTPPHRIARRARTLCRAEPADAKKAAADAETASAEAAETVWGAHYCGGDPCSSGYNSDPFAEQDDKQDAFKAFKERVDALARAKQQ